MAPIFCIVAALASISVASAQEKSTALFDGETLDGWEVIRADERWWSVADGAITGGSLKENIPHNTFISTKKSFQNFDLILKIRIRGAGGGLINSGIQIRSVRVPDSSEMSGYQVDAGDGWWGKMYDESRRNKVISEAADLKRVNAAIRKDDWNEFRIRAEGPRIRSWINGVPAVDYTEKDKNIPLDGHIGIQVHSGGKALVQVKDVTIEQLPPTPDAPTWKRLKRQSDARGTPGKVDAQLSIQSPPRSPEAEQEGFTVPDGFEVELVAAELDGIGKFITVAFDARGRMWTMTALEYPVDANENPERSRRLFARGGRDKVLVFDQPCGKQVSQPRVFADGLVMPLGILPYQDGVYVQYGNDIRFYRDTDGDGSADTHDVVLTGFGTEDSHLFPHQFTRTPGGWILTAQGLYNYSKVRRPDGAAFTSGPHEIAFNQCKLARFTPTGSDFEVLTAGPNNLWGLTISREGETWLQEANDLGYPVIPFEPGGYYRTGSRERLRPYQPLMPPTLAPPQMGGTGLSGLALADDRDGWPTPWGMRGANPDAPRVFYVANPITSSIQAIRATHEGGRYRYEKLPDFLLSEDPKFRPVAIQFGPDGCLYVTDWYNKIISHNEVPRNHPERDKTRGRIWRIRHKSQPHISPPNLMEVPERELLTHLGAPNARIADLAWQSIVDRQATDLAPALERLVIDTELPADRRLGALWALEGLSTVPTSLLVTLSKEPNANIRHEAVRIAAAQIRTNDEFLSVAEALVSDPAPRVRAALGDALRRLQNANPEIVGLMLRLGKAPLDGNSWESYDREFERYLARWAMEQNAEAVGEFLNSQQGKSIPLENRVLGRLAIGGRQAAAGLAELIPNLNRRLTSEEVRTLATHSQDLTVSAALAQLLENSASREETLRALLALRLDLDTAQLHPAIESATRSLWSQSSSDRQRRLALRVAGAYRLQELDKPIAEFAKSAETSTELKLAALRSLRELDSREFSILADIATSQDEPDDVRESALAALANSPTQEAATAVAGLLEAIDFQQRRAVIARLATSRNGALAIVGAVDTESIALEDLSAAVLEQMRTLLPENEAISNLWEEVAAEVRHVFRLKGANDDYSRLPITLAGPFTVETWVRLEPGISNTDGILGRPDVLDMNFHDATFRVWIAGQRDIVIAEHKMAADTWTHVAVTRDAEGTFRIYVNGELSAESTQTNVGLLADLNIGRTIPGNAGTDGALIEYRVWSVERTAREIRDNFDRSFATENRPDELVYYFDGDDWGELSGNAHLQPTLEAPQLLTADEAARQAELFAKYRRLAEQPGDASAGRVIFEKNCLTCHQHAGKGGNVGPALDGVGLTGTEALLRNILTPNAAMEGGYRNYQVVTEAGRIVQGMLASEDAKAVVIRQPDTADQRIAKSDIARAGFTSTSVMPSGLLDALRPQEVSDLFSHLHSLK